MTKLKEIFMLTIGRAIMLLALVFLGGGGILSCKYTMVLQYPEVYGENTIPLERGVGSVIIFMFIVIVSVCIFYLMQKYLQEKDKVIFKIIFVFLLIIHLFFGIFIITNNHAFGGADQLECWTMAREIYEKRDCSYPEYFESNPHQTHLVFWMYVVINITKSSLSMNWKILQLVALIGIDFGIILVTRELADKNKYLNMIMSTLFLLLFIPIVFYTAYIYGTIISMCLIVWSFFYTIRFIKTSLLRYAFIMIILLMLAMQFYTGAIVAVIAICVTLLLSLFKIKFNIKKLCVNICIMIMLALSIIVSNRLIGAWYENATGIDLGKGSPASSYVYMGMTATVGSEYVGSWNAANRDIYFKYGDKANDFAIKETKKVFGQYLSGELDKGFFIEKLKGEWLEPWFGAIGQTVRVDEEMSSSFLTFLNSKFMIIANNVLPYYISFIYIFAAVGTILALLKISKDEFDYSFLIYIYFIGGFIFYLFWEAKARYCLPYFILLIPMAAVSFVGLIRKSNNVIRKNH